MKDVVRDAPAARLGCWRNSARRALLVLLGCCAAAPVPAQPNAAAAGLTSAVGGDSDLLLDKSLTELMAVEVVSASRQRVALGDTAAAVFVITQDDIQRSGARVLPEVLRLAPGVDVARISSGRWAVGVRGDATRFSGGLQVLLDGRSIYSPYFSGVFWDVEQVPLADIERIEIVRGPAGATWGSNAVNGVINIITYGARDTLGTRVDTTLGSDGQRIVQLRRGAALAGGDGAWRLSARASGTSSYRTVDGQPADDQNRNLNLTGRLDRRLARGDLSVQLQALDASDRDHWILANDQPPLFNAPTPVELRFRRLMGSAVATERLGERSQLQLNASLAREQADLRGILETESTRADLQLQHQLGSPGGRHALSYGAGLSGFADRTEGGRYGGLAPAQRQWLDARLFVHDRLTLAPNRLWLSAGALLDHNRYTGWQWQPELGLTWRVSPAQTLWSALGRSSRVPGRGFQDARFSLTNQPLLGDGATEPIAVPVATVSPQPLATQVTGFQLGSRTRFGDMLSLDLTGFSHQYRDLGRFQVPDAAGLGAAAASGQPLYIDWVGTRARSTGIELAADWRIAAGLRSQLALATLRVSSAERPELAPSTLARSPSRLASWRLSWDVAPRVWFDGWLRYSGARAAYLPGELAVPARTTLDLSLRWRVSPRVTLSLAGYNLGASRRVEASSFNSFRLTTPVLIEPAIALKASVRF